jgi:hypothetical protein
VAAAQAEIDRLNKEAEAQTPQPLKTLVPSDAEAVQPQKDIEGKAAVPVPETAKGIVAPDKPLSPADIPKFQGVKLPPDKAAQVQDAKVRFAEAKTETATDAAPIGKSEQTIGPPTGQFSGEAGAAKEVAVAKPETAPRSELPETPTRSEAFSAALKAAKDTA